jgi:hypothetical protein
MALTDLQRQHLEVLKSKHGDTEILSKKVIFDTIKDEGFKPPYWLTSSDKREKRGYFRIPYDLLDDTVSDKDLKKVAKSVASKPPVSKKVVVEKTKEVETEVVNKAISFIPEVDKDYVQFGNYKHISNIIKSKIFYPVFISGLSGNGKTFSVEQACAKLKREMVRVNITIETDEDDLLGGFRLVNGETVFHAGPVVDAMERGAILLLDEVDLASNKILALQPVLEGKGVYLKKINKWIKPAEGFNVIATANTKGKGSESGAFIGTNILNEAFLERFAITLEQEYPPVATEGKIVRNVFTSHGIEDDDFAKNLVDWADIIRKTYDDGGTDEVISTRRLVHIANAYKIFGDKKTAIDLCIARFDEDTKVTFNELYTKIDADPVLIEETVEVVEDLDTTPF